MENVSVINECEFPQLVDCHPSAECIDQLVGYTCRCRPGFKDMGDKPGRMCKPREWAFMKVIVKP